MPGEFIAVLARVAVLSARTLTKVKAFPDQVHFIVDVVRYESHGRQRKGVCSCFMAERTENETIPVFPTTSKFRLPEIPTRP